MSSAQPQKRTSDTSAATTTGGTLGLGLMALGGVIGVLFVLWLIANLATGALQVTGAIFSLIFVALIALPLVGAGWYLRQRGAVEAVEAQTFTARRGILDSDRVLRRELARELEQRNAGLLTAAHTLPPEQAAQVEGAGRRLQEVARNVTNPGYDTTTWLEQTAAQLDQPALDNIRRYDDLVLEEARRLGDLERDLGRDPQAAAQLESRVSALASHVREREDLLGRGRRAATMSPQELLAAGTQLRRPLATPLELRLGDAVSYESSDYLVRALLTYFAGGRSWRAYQLHDGRQERWLEVRAQGADTAWYAPHAPVADSGISVEVDGVAFQQQETGSTSVSIESAAGAQEGVLVDYRRYTAPTGDRLLAERWPDGPRALLGRAVAPEDLQLWTKPPAAE